MSWTYLELNPDGTRDQPLPPNNTIYRGFDALRWRQFVCMTESTVDVISILNPNVDDDCQIIAIAPLDEWAAPDEDRLRQIWEKFLGGPDDQCPTYKDTKNNWPRLIIQSGMLFMHCCTLDTPP